jgi:hypothetical protein
MHNQYGIYQASVVHYPQPGAVSGTTANCAVELAIGYVVYPVIIPSCLNFSGIIKIIGIVGTGPIYVVTYYGENRGHVDRQLI